MVIEIINKILMMILILSSVNIIRQAFFAILAWTKRNEESIKYELTNRELIQLGLSISFILTSMITGINL